MNDPEESVAPASGVQGAAADSRMSARGPHFGLRRASELVQAAAFELAGRTSPAEISRLIEIAAELDRFARGGPEGPPPDGDGTGRR